MMEHEELFPLLLKIAKGNKDAFEALYTATSAQMYAIALKMLRSQELAEEATQEAYVRIWYNASSYREGQGTVLTWMVSIVRYRALDMLRHAKVRKEQSLEPEITASLVAETESLVMDDSKLDRCLQALENPQRQAIHLAYFNGLSHAEVVESLDTPLGTIKSWIRRGLQSLQKCLSI
jgi:RNA polymerase sigma-70 factor (ECF subfamily)